MRCLSCQNDVLSKDAKIVLQMYLCPSCAEMATKMEKELDAEMARAAQTAKSVLVEHIMKGGLVRTGFSAEEPITKEFPLPHNKGR